MSDALADEDDERDEVDANEVAKGSPVDEDEDEDIVTVKHAAAV